MRLFQEISGQIFEVDEKMLQFLDDFEEHPNVYQRVEVNVMVESGMLTVRGQESVKKVPKLFYKVLLPHHAVLFFWSRNKPNLYVYNTDTNL